MKSEGAPDICRANKCDHSAIRWYVDCISSETDCTWFILLLAWHYLMDEVACGGFWSLNLPGRCNLYGFSQLVPSVSEGTSIQRNLVHLPSVHFVSLWSRYTSEVHNLLMGQYKVGFNFLFFLFLNTRSSLAGLVQTGSRGVLSLLTALKSGSYTVNLQHWHLTQWIFMVLGYVFQIPAGTENTKASSV